METNNRTLHFPNHDELNKHTSYVGHWKILENTWEINGKCSPPPLFQARDLNL